MSFVADNSQEQKFLYTPMAQPELGNRIKEARKEAKLSQRQLGEQLNVSYQTIANWENGLRAPIEANLVRLSIALGKSDDFFFSRVSTQETEPVISTLSENLRTYRKRYSLSQVQLSERTGISLVNIKAYEDGNSGRFITDKNLDILCEVFGAKREDLLGKSVTAETMQDMTIGNYLREIEEAVKKLNLTGLQKAAERIAELTELPRYRK